MRFMVNSDLRFTRISASFSSKDRAALEGALLDLIDKMGVKTPSDKALSAAANQQSFKTGGLLLSLKTDGDSLMVEASFKRRGSYDLGCLFLSRLERADLGETFVRVHWTENGFLDETEDSASSICEELRRRWQARRESRVKFDRNDLGAWGGGW